MRYFIRTTLVGGIIFLLPLVIVAVYLPGAPDPRSGVLSYLTADRVQPIDTGFTEIARTCKKLGRGSGAMLAEQL